jgi:D-amino-acid dehydrogenase
MMRNDSPLYIRPRLDPAFLRWLVTFWRHCNERDYRAGREATFALAARTMALLDRMGGDGVRFEEHRAGLLHAYLDPRALDHDLALLDRLGTDGFEPHQVLTRDAIQILEPGLAETVAGGYRYPHERHVRPDDLVDGLRAWLESRGVEIWECCSVAGVRAVNGPGGRRVDALETARGVVPVTAVVVCAGVWTPQVLRRFGAGSLPIEAGKGYSLDWEPPPVALRQAISLHEARVAVTPLTGMLRLAGTMELSGHNDRLAPSRIAAIARAGRHYLRDWPGDRQPVRVWSGMRPMTADGLPVIGSMPGWTNLVVASGHAMLGLTLGPATGEAVADLLDRTAPAELAPFAPSRFYR